MARAVFERQRALQTWLKSVQHGNTKGSQIPQPDAIKDDSGDKVQQTQPGLREGEVEITSQHLPAFAAGEYSINISHNFNIGGEVDENGKKITRSLYHSKPITLIAPRFSLDENAVHAVYPPPGSEIPCNVLPHIVLHDPYLPWARKIAQVAVPTTGFSVPMPWLCLMLFDPSELLLSEEELGGPDGKGSGSIFPSITNATAFLRKDLVQTATYGLDVSVANLKDNDCKAQTPFSSEGGPFKDIISTTTSDKERLSVILPERKTFERLFPWTEPGASFYRYLCHVRNVDKSSMPDLFGTTDADIDGRSKYSILLSPRCGQLNLAQPRTVVVHLVSVESIQAIHEVKATAVPNERVSLISLYSWTYSATPVNSVDFLDTMRDLGLGLQRLRPLDDTIDGLSQRSGDPSQTKQKKWLASRLNEGFTFVRHRLATGDVTTSLYRSPFTPTVVPHPLDASPMTPFPPASSFGSDLQIVDHKTGLIDVSYNLAWDLGRNIAMADQSFSTSLLRIRNAIHAMAIKEASSTVLRSEDIFVDWETVYTRISTLGTDLQVGLAPVENVASPRWAQGRRRPGLSTTRKDLSFSNPSMKTSLETEFHNAARLIASGTNGKPYVEGSPPTNPDWPIVLDWLLSKMYFKGVPPQYILPDTSHLPPESLRSFHVDHNWVDCLIDGALGVVNRFDQHDGDIRDAIKAQLNAYLQTEVNSTFLGVPCWGFLMRSAVVKAFPNLEIKACGNGDQAAFQARKCIHNVISDDIVMCVFDRGTSAGAFSEGFTISQPLHEQFFSVGSLNVKDKDKDMHIELAATMPGNADSLYTMITMNKAATTLTHDAQSVTVDEPILDFDSRTFIFPSLVNVLAQAYSRLPQDQSSTTPRPLPTKSEDVTSSVVCDALSDKPYKLDLDDADQDDSVNEDDYRTIYTPKPTKPVGSSSRRLQSVATVARKLPIKAEIHSLDDNLHVQAQHGAREAIQRQEVVLQTAATLQTPSSPVTEPDHVNSEDFSPEYPFPQSLFKVEASNNQARNWFYLRTGSEPNAWTVATERGPDARAVKAIWIPTNRPGQDAAQEKPISASLLFDRVIRRSGSLCLNQLVIRIPVGLLQYSGEYACPLFNHRLLPSPIAPAAKVVGPRWVTSTSFEYGPDRDFYVITVSPRVGIDPLFGWPVKDIDSLNIILPPLRLRPLDSSGRNQSPTKPSPVMPSDNNMSVSEVTLKVHQRYTWNPRLFWEVAGTRDEEMKVWMIVNQSKYL